MTTPQPSRRWCRFSLRTLFVVATVAAVPLAWMGYQLNWIRQRHEYFLSDTPIWSLPNFESTAPGMLWLFGEKGLDSIGSYVPVEDAAEHQAEMKRLFPETKGTIRTYK